MSHKLSSWLASQNIHESKTAPEDHAANGRAEVAVREVKHLARRCLLSSQASEQAWRRTMTIMAFGIKVQAKNRES